MLCATLGTAIYYIPQKESSKYLEQKQIHGKAMKVLFWSLIAMSLTSYVKEKILPSEIISPSTL